MNYKTEARLVYGGLLVFLLLFARIVAGWYGVFERHSPERALAAEIENDIGHDVLMVTFSNDIIEDEETLLVYVMVDGPVAEEEATSWVGSRAPAVFYFYRTQALNSGNDGSIQNVLYSIGFMLCFSLGDCGWRPTDTFVADADVQNWWFGFEKGSQLWVKSERNILLKIERIFKPEVDANQQSFEEINQEWSLR